MMQIVFFSTSILGLLYFLLAKRQFDFFTIGFFSACVYFLPGYMGYTFYPSDSGGVWVPGLTGVGK